MKVTKIVALATLTLACAACSETGNDNAIYFTNYSAYSAYVLDNSAHDFGQEKDAEYSDSVSLVMPERIGNNDIRALRDSIVSFAIGCTGDVEPAVAKWMDKSANDLGYKAKRIDPAESNDEAAQGYDYVNGFVANLNAEMLVYCVRKENYMPNAAHGLTTRRYINYVLADGGKIITLDDLFTAEGLKMLPDRIAEQAQALSDVIGETQVSGLPGGNNFYISSEGEIVFSYQPYEIASYAQGTIDIPFYPYELVELMTPAGITLFHLEDLE